MHLVQASISQIKSKRKRLTDTRKSVIEIICKSAKPISAPQILAMLHERGLTVNKTTVYRELAFLHSEDIIREVKLTPFIVHYESAQLNHHHHLVCTNCGEISEIVCNEIEKPMQSLEKRVKQNGFQIKDHNLEFYGLCQNCN